MPGLERIAVTDKNGVKTHRWVGSRGAAEAIAKNGGMIDQRFQKPESKVIVTTERTLLDGTVEHRDSRGRLHSPSGEPAVMHPNGTADYYFQGVPYAKPRYPALNLTHQQEQNGRAQQERRREMFDLLGGGRTGNTPAQARGQNVRTQTVYFWKGRPFKSEGDWYAARRMHPKEFEAQHPVSIPTVKLATHTP